METTYKEATLLDYLNIVIKKKYILLSLIFISLAATLFISLRTPKTYLGEVVFKISVKETTTGGDVIKGTETTSTKEIKAIELVNSLGTINSEKINRFLPNVGKSITYLKLEPLKDSTDKFTATVESIKRENIPKNLSDLNKFLDEYPLIKNTVNREKERLNFQYKELSSAVESLNNISQVFTEIKNPDRITSLGFNPVDFYKNLSELKVKMLGVKQSLQNLKGVESVGEAYISKYPVKPNIKFNLIIAGFISIFVGLLLIFLIDYVEKSIQIDSRKKR